MMNQIAAFIVGALFVAGSAFAQDFDSPDKIAAKAAAFNRLGRDIYKHQNPLLRIADAQIHAECLDLLWATEQRVGRHLTAEEILRVLPNILAALSGEAEQTPNISAINRIQEGLDLSTKVLTLNEPTYIALLRPGSEVLSYDLNASALVTNKVVGIHGGIPKSILIVRPGLRGHLAPVMVNVNQPFYRPSAFSYRALGNAVKEGELLFLPSNSSRKKPGPVPIGSLSKVTHQDSATFQLQLDSEPHNFFANGILVQSYVEGNGDK
jgi:hypothetical protein